MSGRLREISIGSEYIFFFGFPDGDCESLIHYNGRKCKTTQKWEKDQYIGAAEWEAVNSHGGLYEVEFFDGAEFDVYGDELYDLDSCVELKSGFYLKKGDC